VLSYLPGLTDRARNIFSPRPEHSRATSVPRSAKGCNVLFQAPPMRTRRTLGVFLLGGVAPLFAPLLRECPVRIDSSLLLLPLLRCSSEDRRNDPLMENATPKEERLLSLATWTSSPATLPALPSLLPPRHSSLIRYPVFFGEGNPLSFSAARCSFKNMP